MFTLWLLPTYGHVGLRALAQPTKAKSTPSSSSRSGDPAFKELQSRAGFPCKLILFSFPSSS
jgi:hypothetical protein